MIKLGSKVKDKITGLEGTATGRAIYISGCIQILIEPPAKSGSEHREIWIDEDRLEEVEESKELPRLFPHGGPSSSPPPRSKGR